MFTSFLSFLSLLVLSSRFIFVVPYRIPQHYHHNHHLYSDYPSYQWFLLTFSFFFFFYLWFRRVSLVTPSSNAPVPSQTQNHLVKVNSGCMELLLLFLFHSGCFPLFPSPLFFLLFYVQKPFLEAMVFFGRGEVEHRKFWDSHR